MDAGLTWKVLKAGATKYEVGDQGGVIVVVDDEESVDYVEYSTDYGSTWFVLTLLLFVHAMRIILTSISGSHFFLQEEIHPPV